MKHFMHAFCLCCACACAALTMPAQAAAEHSNITLRMILGGPSGQELTYSLNYHGHAIIQDSPLGLNVDHRLLGQSVTSLKADSLDSAGHHVMYTARRADGTTFRIETRLWPESGMALRYHIPIPQDGKSVCIYDEQTAFTFTSGTRVWYASGPFQYGWIQAYQDRQVDQIAGELLAPPATFRTPEGIYAAITEANLRRGFHGAVLFGEAPRTVRLGYVENRGHLVSGRITGMPPSKYAHQVVRNVPWIATPAAGQTEIVTPWRVLMLAENLNGLANNPIIAQVADKPDPTLFPQGARTEWIKPGRAVFTWLTEGGTERLSVANHKRYVDGCAELGIETVVVDDGWEHWPETEPQAAGRSKWDMLKELVDYARQRGVNIWVWRPSSPRAGNSSDVGLEDPDERRAFMKKCAEIGVKGLKIDFFHTENAFTIGLMEDILSDAARARLMVIFHGVNKPTGDSYTYPNLLAKEAVRGLECVGGENTWAPGPPWPYHNTVIPFTRWLAGPADYTPLNFRAFCPSAVTFGHQLATLYVLTSPMLIMAADMDDMLRCPARQFIEEVPVEWDETYVLPESQIGRLAAIARRKANVWYLGIMGGNAADSTFHFDLSFLPRGSYRVQLATDAPGNRRLLQTRTFTLRAPGRGLSLPLQAGGGAVLRIEKKS